MKRIKILPHLLFCTLILFTACSTEENTLDDNSNTADLASDILGFDLNAIAIDIDNLPEGFELEEEILTEDAANRTCCHITDISFVGTTQFFIRATINPYRSFYWQFFDNGSQVASYSYYNNTPFCKSLKLATLHGQKCNGLSARGVMGVGYNLCAEEYAYCN